MKEEKKDEELKEDIQENVEETTPETEQTPQEKEEKEPTVEEQLDAANTEIASLKDQLLRKIAEFDNYRKRTIKEKTDLILNGGEKTIVTILPVLDDMKRALKNMKSADDVNAVLEDVELIYKNSWIYSPSKASASSTRKKLTSTWTSTKPLPNCQLPHPN